MPVRKVRNIADQRGNLGEIHRKADGVRRRSRVPQGTNVVLGPGNIISPHSHPVDVHLTVLKGTLYFSSGRKFDRATLTELETGGYVFIPKGSMIFSYAPEEAVVQIHDVGPFQTDFADGMKVLSEPNDQTAFKFKIGDLVIAKRGKGQIRQGWAFGEITQYRI